MSKGSDLSIGRACAFDDRGHAAEAARVPASASPDHGDPDEGAMIEIVEQLFGVARRGATTQSEPRK